MPGLLDANLCKNKQTNKQQHYHAYVHIIPCAYDYMALYGYISPLKVLFIVCFCLFLHKLTSNKPGIY